MPASRGTSAAVTVTRNSRGILVGEARTRSQIPVSERENLIRAKYYVLIFVKFPVIESRTRSISSLGEMGVIIISEITRRIIELIQAQETETTARN